MGNTINDVVIINRYDYNELVKKAEATDESIKKKAEAISLEQNRATITVDFNRYQNPKGFQCISVTQHYYEKEAIMDSLSRVESAIYEWAKEGLKKFEIELKDMNITKRNSIGLSKRVVNLEAIIKKQRLKYILLCSYSVVVSVVVFLLLNSIK